MVIQRVYPNFGGVSRGAYLDGFEKRGPITVSWSNEAGPRTPEQAKQACDQKIDGVTGWRLPTVDEVKARTSEQGLFYWASPVGKVATRNGVQDYSVLAELKSSQFALFCLHPTYVRGAAPAAATKASPIPVKAAPKPVGSPTAVLTRATPSVPKPQPVAAPSPKTYTVEATSSFGATARTEAEARQKVEADMKRAGNNSYQKFKRSGPIACTPGIAFGGVPGPVQCSATAYYDAVSDKPMPPSTSGTPCKEPGCSIAR